ncbi:unnamed protein product [Adineta steineri]|uniref:Uncharacterized protein n=1 Tax=Adineta steineri TaxID=433720 RepID=A0A815VGN6_9BILA|nr:unnamed protein product [Adineta steineri]CAF1530267.1 unnamed protein product [Adineta steineri]CAF1653368.1 unnamed protein product [Adineta steineri]CAF1653377.1 unnamed protein product [Adineta steineri]
MTARFGMVAVGLVLEHVKKLNVFKEITEIYILVPALIGLKRNLEMILASRLPTHICVGGNLVAVQASRLSTILHQQCKPGEFQGITQY